MLCRWHGVGPGRRFAPPIITVIFVLFVLFLANPINPSNPLSPGRDGLPTGGTKSKVAPPIATRPPAVPEERQLPLPPKRIATGEPRAIGFIYPEGDGLVLSQARASLESPDGKAILMLQRDGDLVLRTLGADGFLNIVWSTGTGGREDAGTREVSVVSWPDSHPVLEVSATKGGERRVLWHSNLLPDCASQSLKTTNLTKDSRLELSGSGRLTLWNVCDLYLPAPEREDSRSLAVILSGTYQPDQDLCAETLLAHPAFSAVDVFAHIVFTGSDNNGTREAIDAALRECYGDALRAAIVLSSSKAEEVYPGSKEALGGCADKVDDVNHRLKNLFDAGRTWWSWSSGNGVRHDTVLALRAGGQLGVGGEVYPFRALEELGDTLVVVQDKGADYLYCPRMTGGIGIAPFEHVTYGSPAAMSHYTNLYTNPSLPDMLHLASGPNGPSYRDFSGCEVLPSGPLPEDCPRPATCAAECLVAWYLDSVGVGFEVEWWE